MQPQYISLATIFGLQARYTVPLFQRPYVWTRTGQWEPLWDDIQALADRVLASRGDDIIAGHFLGTAVLEQAKTATGSLPRREIIDGQQRLTTLQLLLKAAQHALIAVRDGHEDPDVRKSFEVAARQIDFLTANPAFNDDVEKYKVWPTNQDRAPFQEVMDTQCAVEAPRSGNRMAEAYGYFFDQITAWLQGEPAEGRAAAFSGAIKDHLRLIVLDLDDADEPQAIFETLNAHGTPLLPADLIKNWMIWEGSTQKLDAVALYEHGWKHFDAASTYWRETVGAGHAARARIDTFLQNWLTRRTRKGVPPKHLYDAFLRHVGARPQVIAAERCDVVALSKDIQADAQRYRCIVNPEGSTRFDTFLRRLKVFDFVVFQPVLMQLLGRPGSDAQDLDRIGLAMESFLLRRMICGDETRGYGTFALSLLDTLASLPDDEPAAPALIAHLINPRNLGIPDDERFRANWVTKPFYGYFRRDRVLMILRAIEERLMTSTNLSEPIVAFNYDKLQVEHIMPQNWEQHWPLLEGADRAVRERRIHGIGNLTLVSEKLNPSLSNAPWNDWTTGSKTHRGKRSGLSDHSALRMNLKIATAHPNDWDEEAIDARAHELFEIAAKLWPSPSPPVENP